MHLLCNIELCRLQTFAFYAFAKQKRLHHLLPCSSGHVPVWHVPIGHVPVGQEKEPALPLVAVVLNADNCFLGFCALHFGHFGADSEKLRARCSNAFPHLPHLYSYIGIFLLLFLRLKFLLYHFIIPLLTVQSGIQFPCIPILR